MVQDPSCGSEPPINPQITEKPPNDRETPTAMCLLHTQAPPRQSGAAQIRSRILHQQVLPLDQYGQCKDQLQSLRLGSIPIITDILIGAHFRLLCPSLAATKRGRISRRKFGVQRETAPHFPASTSTILQQHSHQHRPSVASAIQCHLGVAGLTSALRAF